MVIPSSLREEVSIFEFFWQIKESTSFSKEEGMTIQDLSMLNDALMMPFLR